MVKCPFCDYEFNSKSVLYKISCSSCGNKIFNPNSKYQKKKKKLTPEDRIKMFMGIKK